MAVDREFLKERNLLDAHKHFLHLINEATYFSGQLDEEGDDDNQQDGNMPPQDENNPMGDGSNAMGDDMNGGGMPQGDPNMGGDPNAMGDGNPMDGGDPNMMGQDPNGGMGDDPNMMGGDMPPMDDMPMDDPMGGEMEEDEEVIDVEDITNAQEKTHDKVNKVGRNLGKVDDKIEALLQTVETLLGMVDANNEKIAQFEREFEKRNPTPTEKLNLRSLDSYPFNVNPKDYWNKKREEHRGDRTVYDAYADNSEPTSHVEYTITDDDIENYDEKKIADSFHIDDDLRMTIEKIFDI